MSLSHDNTELVDALEQELNKSRDDQKIFHFLRPRPHTEDNDWYDWNVTHWGTKWDAWFPNVEDYSRDDCSLSLNFDTAWSPPIALYEYLTENGWKIEAYYHEPGMCFCGKFENGIDDCYEYNMTEESINDIPEDIASYANLETELEDFLAFKEEEE